MTLLLLLLVVQIPEADLLEDDVSLPDDFPWSEVLAELRAKPLDVNSASEATMLQIPFLSVQEVEQIITLRDSLGAITDLTQLCLLPTFDSLRVNQLRQYLMTNSPRRSDRSVFPNASYLVRLRCDSINTGDCLSRLAATEKIGLSGNGISASFVAARQAGEQSFLDFLSGGLEYQWRRFCLLLGDYELHAGQGLVLARPHSFRKLAGMMRMPQLPVASLSATTSENSRLSGLSLSKETQFWRFTIFASRRRWDAVPNLDMTVRKIIYTGRHDDSSTIANRGRLNEDLAGGYAGITTGNLNAAVCGYANYYEPLVRAGKGFQGHQLQVVALNLFQRLNEYGLGIELAKTVGHGWGGAFDLLGEWQRLSSRVTVCYLQSNFFSPHSRSRSLERPRDDLDASLRINYRADKWEVIVNAAAQQDFVGDSMPARVELIFRNRSTPFGVDLRWRQSFKNEAPLTTGSRFGINYRVTPVIVLTARLEDKFKVARRAERRTALTLGVSYRRDFQFDINLTGYAGKGREVSIFAYENGVPENNRILYGNGWRVSASGRKKLSRHFSAALSLGVEHSERLIADGGIELRGSFGR